MLRAERWMRISAPRFCTWAVAERLSRAAGVAVIFDYGEEAQEIVLDENVYNAVLHMGWSRTGVWLSLCCCDNRLSRCVVWLWFVNNMMRGKRRERVDKYKILMLTVVVVVLEM